MLFMLCFVFSIFYSVLSLDGFLSSRNCLYWWECHLRTMISVIVLHRNRENENVCFLLFLWISLYCECLYSSFMSLPFLLSLLLGWGRGTMGMCRLAGQHSISLNRIICLLLVVTESLNVSEELYDHRFHWVLRTVLEQSFDTIALQLSVSHLVSLRLLALHFVLIVLPSW